MSKGVAPLVMALVIAVVLIVLIVTVVVLMQGSKPVSPESQPWGYNNGYTTPNDGYNPPADDGSGVDLPKIPETPETPETPATAYRTASKLTTITFTRKVSDPYNSYSGTGIHDLNMSFKITGYLKEADPASDALTTFADRAFEFDGGKVEWGISEYTHNADPKCTHIVSVSSSGTDSISNLNVFYEVTNGQATSISGSKLQSYGKLMLKFDDPAISGRPELALTGAVMIPFDVVETIEVHDTSAHIKTTCNGLTETTSDTKKESTNTMLSLVLFLDLTKSSYTGSATLNEADSYGHVVGQTATLRGLVTTTYETFIPSEGPWDITWDIELPE